MSKAKSAEEAAIPGDRMEQAKGSPDMKPYPVSSTLPEGMPMPSSEGEQAMGGVHKSGHMGNDSMGAAVRQLNYETERGAHAPSVAGDAAAGMKHHGILAKE